MSGRCPNCASTDIADRTDSKCECLDCSFVWEPRRRVSVPPWLRKSCPSGSLVGLEDARYMAERRENHRNRQPGLGAPS